MKTYDKHFAIAAAVMGTAVIIIAVVSGAWFHIATGSALFLLSRAYWREHKRITSN
jgi:hypothetical protein